MKKLLVLFSFLTMLFVSNTFALDFSSAIKNQLISDTIQKWEEINPYEKITEAFEIGDTIEDLSVDGDIVYQNNLKYLEQQKQKRLEIEKNLDEILQKIANKKLDKINVEGNYKQYIEIEDIVNKADKILILQLPVNKFILKEDDKGKSYIVLIKKPLFKSQLGKDTTKGLVTTINNEIEDIISSPTIKVMNEKISSISDKKKRNYAPLFKVKSYDAFFESLTTTISYGDNAYVSTYNLPQKKYMNSLYYIPKKLSSLKEKTDKYFYIYIPLMGTKDVLDLLQGIQTDPKMIYLGPSFCWKTVFNDEFMYFQNLMCGAEQTMKGKIKVVPTKIYNKNNYFIKLDKAGWLSVILSVIILGIGFIFPKFFTKIVADRVNHASKFETEQV